MTKLVFIYQRFQLQSFKCHVFVNMTNINKTFFCQPEHVYCLKQLLEGISIRNAY